jgi:hypothetical protein
MSLMQEALAAAQGRGSRCLTGSWIATLTDAERDEVVEAMAAPEVQHAALYRAIKARWSDAPGPDSVIRHRKRECVCP